MIRKADVQGLDVPGLTESIKATLFADDTTVYLAESDDFGVIQRILDKWCSASKAKFNIAKTEILPIGTKEYRDATVREYRQTGKHGGLPERARIAADGEAVRILGAYVGNKVDQAGLWTLKIDKVEKVLDRWAKHHATMIGKKHAIQLVVGGMTQFFADVQGMPPQAITRLNKMISGYLWEGKAVAPIKADEL
ncbi:hypothetical protein FKP32DRAFT_1561253 [Trametes sanguinea]|nr:hypothetical protein FKP32DRAFT_1561253 [Trametes sanguinea]